MSVIVVILVSDKMSTLIIPDIKVNYVRKGNVNSRQTSKRQHDRIVRTEITNCLDTRNNYVPNYACFQTATLIPQNPHLRGHPKGHGHTQGQVLARTLKSFSFMISPDKMHRQ